VAAAAETRPITDMAGRQVVVPKTITKVHTDWSILSYLVYAVAPDLLAAVNAPFTEEQKKLLSPAVRQLPVVGGFFGTGRVGGLESLMNVKPDLVLAEMSENLALNRPAEERLASVGIPVVYVKLDTVDDYPAAISFLGTLLGRETRARTLSTYGQNVLSDIARTARALPEGRRPRVYYAEGPTGLLTECHTSLHAELIALTGAVNVHHCSEGLVKVKGKERVNLEQVLLYDPDVIIVAEPEFYESVGKDPRWRSIKAVKSGRVHLIPRLLFNWFDRPPSFMRLLGVQWVMWRLYPEAYRVEIEAEARKFYRLFLGLDIPSATMRKVLAL
jgi:iron complex transport system substrate-binding protein